MQLVCWWCFMTSLIHVILRSCFKITHLEDWFMNTWHKQKKQINKKKLLKYNIFANLNWSNSLDGNSLFWVSSTKDIPELDALQICQRGTVIRWFCKTYLILVKHRFYWAGTSVCCHLCAMERKESLQTQNQRRKSRKYTCSTTHIIYFRWLA